ncbi:MAG: hypothetical protein GWN16_11115 [Calditrichae bacterium]|nr:hypothetical protein [Calditrichia bacterium]
MSAAEMALWARTPDLRQSDIHAALWENHTLIKTSCMRQTLHLIPAADYFVFINALKRSRFEALWRIMAKFRITPSEYDSMNEEIMEALSDGPLTQRELIKEIKPKVEDNVRTWMAHVWSIFKPVLAEGLICYGPNQGQQVTFVRVDQWLPKRDEVAEQEARQTLLRRFLSAFAPATVQDFSKWSGMPMKEAKQIWKSSEDEMVEVSVEGQPTFILNQDLEDLKNRPAKSQPLRLLPNFDSYLLGHVDKNHLVDAKYYKRVYRNQGWISSVILLDGKVIGIWSYKQRKDRILVEIDPFEKISKAVSHQIENEAERLGRFIGYPVAVKS